MLNEKCQWGDGVITKSQLKSIERVFDALFLKLNIDVKFTSHFFDRINDDRNKKQITICEISKIFSELYKKYGLHLKQIGNSHKEVEEIIKSTSTNINIPFVIKWDKRKNEIVLVTKTIMRKKNFKGNNKVLRVESFKQFLINEFWMKNKKKLHEIVSEIKSIEKNVNEKKKKNILKNVKKIYTSNIQDKEIIIDYDHYSIEYEFGNDKVQALLSKLSSNKLEKKLVNLVYVYFTSNEIIGFQNTDKTEQTLKNVMRIK